MLMIGKAAIGIESLDRIRRIARTIRRPALAKWFVGEPLNHRSGSVADRYVGTNIVMVQIIRHKATSPILALECEFSLKLSEFHLKDVTSVSVNKRSPDPEF
jgi:hypothetical protein